MAAVTTGVIVGGASAYSAYSGKKAAERAARSQSRAARESQDEFQRQFDIEQEALSPYREVGGLALERQAELAGLRGTDIQRDAFESFSRSPAQQFIEEQGLRLVNTGSATSGAGGGERLRALTRFGQGLAAQRIDDYYNRLGGLSGVGYQATTGGLQLGAQNIANQSALREQAAAARASGILGGQQATSQALQGGLSLLPYFAGIGRGTPPPSGGGIAMNVTNPNIYGAVA